MGASDMVRRAEETLALLAESPMGMRVKSGPWLRAQLYAASRDVIELGRSAKLLEALFDIHECRCSCGRDQDAA